MEEVVDNVVKKFEETERNLQQIEDRLETNFAKQLTENGSGDCSADKATLLRELDEVKESYADIRREAAELGNLQREMAIAFQKQLLSTVQKLQALTDKENLAKNPEEATSNAIESLVEQSKLAENLTNKLRDPNQSSNFG